MLPRILFVTDPLCSWCWGTLPQIEMCRRALADEASFDFIVAGMQLGSPMGLPDFEKRQLHKLWDAVREVSGQPFSGIIPDDMIYHSEITCRAVEFARQQAGSPPWAFLHDVQSAFYAAGQDTTRSEVIAPLLGVSHDTLTQALKDQAIIETTQANFELVEK
ncbi:MAG: hypothetical protein KDI19_14045, partial [Pseudomonadales bacterium]|nr:hypothetical protein [Pseudomonadales bacterium]